MSKLTLDDIEQTPLGKQILAERAELEAATTEAKRQADAAQVTEARRVLNELMPDYIKRRDALLSVLVKAAEEAEELALLRKRMQAHQRLARSAGGSIAIPELLSVQAQMIAETKLRQQLASIKALWVGNL